MMAAERGADDRARAERLIALFHRPTAGFARVSPVEGSALPPPFAGLLDHASHMTVAMERFYKGPVSVAILAVHDLEDGSANGRTWYEREILLRTADGQVVQHGIVRIDLGCVSSRVAAEIRDGQTPLGHVLIAAGLLLEVQRVGLIRVDIGPQLGALFGPGGPDSDPARQTFGRVAEITLDGVPAVELLEIVAPGPLPKVLP
ncbi:MAG: hypothetical protein WCR51_01840 [Planctomycetia bacterium]